MGLAHPGGANGEPVRGWEPPPTARQLHRGRGPTIPHGGFGAGPAFGATALSPLDFRVPGPPPCTGSPPGNIRASRRWRPEARCFGFDGTSGALSPTRKLSFDNALRLFRHASDLYQIEQARQILQQATGFEACLLAVVKTPVVKTDFVGSDLRSGSAPMCHIWPPCNTNRYHRSKLSFRRGQCKNFLERFFQAVPAGVGGRAFRQAA